MKVYNQSVRGQAPPFWQVDANCRLKVLTDIVIVNVEIAVDVVMRSRNQNLFYLHFQLKQVHRAFFKNTNSMLNINM